MMFARWLIRWSSKRMQGIHSNPKTGYLIHGTNLLIRGVPIAFPSHKIHPLPYHKEPQHHRTPKLLKIGMTPIL